MSVQGCVRMAGVDARGRRCTGWRSRSMQPKVPHLPKGVQEGLARHGEKWQRCSGRATHLSYGRSLLVSPVVLLTYIAIASSYSQPEGSLPSDLAFGSPAARPSSPTRVPAPVEVEAAASAASSASMAASTSANSPSIGWREKGCQAG